ncbi:hypothetical protein D9M70_433380 [compost metagenome]
MSRCAVLQRLAQGRLSTAIRGVEDIFALTKSQQRSFVVVPQVAKPSEILGLQTC